MATIRMRFPEAVCSTSFGELDADHCVDMDASQQAEAERHGAVRIAHPSEGGGTPAPEPEKPARRRRREDE